MLPLGLAWIVLTPYLVGLAVGNIDLLNRIVTRHLVLASVIGWTALVTLVVTVMAIGEGAGSATPLLAAPFAGLAFWVPSRETGGNGGHARPEAPKAVPPGRVLAQPPRRRSGAPAPQRHGRRRSDRPLTRSH